MQRERVAAGVAGVLRGVVAAKVLKGEGGEGGGGKRVEVEREGGREWVEMRRERMRGWKRAAARAALCKTMPPSAFASLLSPAPLRHNATALLHYNQDTTTNSDAAHTLAPCSSTSVPALTSIGSNASRS